MAGIKGWKSTSYYKGNNSWDTEKSMQLAELQKIDPTMDEQIASYANQFMGEATSIGGRALFAGNEKDIYSMAQDKYLGEMKAYLGVRNAHQKQKNPMLY